MVGTTTGCAALPNVTTLIDDAPTGQKPRPIVSTKGQLSPLKSKSVVDRLKQSVGPTDVLERLTAVVESVTESPLTKGNKVILLADGKAAYAAMFKAISGAKNHINLESYIIEDDIIGHSFADLLLKKQREGVQINIMYDSMGSNKTPTAFFQRLRDNGIRVVEFNPVNPLKTTSNWELIHRDHRKMLITDGTLAIIGGINISKVYSSSPLKRKKSATTPIHWRDTDIQVEGPAVAEFQKLFIDSWVRQKGADLSGPNYYPVLKEQGTALLRVIGSIPGEANRIPFIVYVSAISLAEHSIHLTNSYFIPDTQILKALTDASGRGVDVTIILPGVTDSSLVLHAQRYNYAALLKAGVKIYEHDTSLLHAKTAVIDSVWSTVGSTNMDFLSLLNNDEVNAIILNREFAGEMEKMFASDLANSTQIRRDQWEKRSVVPKFKEWFVNLFVRWL
jgi:cardiolipin synthase